MQQNREEKDESREQGNSPEHFLLLGRVVAGCAMLELNLGMTLRGQLGLDVPTSNILVSGMRLGQLIDKVIELARYQFHGTSVLQDLEDWAQRVRKAVQGRNAAIHSAWISNPLPGTLMSTSFQKAAHTATFTQRTWTYSELEDLVSEINVLASELLSFWQRMGHIAGVPREEPISG